jgi:Prokaryotic E2 family E
MTAETAVRHGAGMTAPRRTFSLPEADEEFLDANYPGWETIKDGATPWLILNDFPVPEGYDHCKVQAAIQISSGYPNAQLDMVYLLPGISRTNGRQINNLSPQTIEGQSWQRWSRHYPWRTGVDDLSTHIERIKSWLANELNR